MTRSGIYGLFNLDGAPVDPRDAAIVGLTTTGANGHVAHAVDGANPGAVHIDRSDGQLTILLGYLEEGAALAARLDLAAATPLAALARAALVRFGPAATAAMIGEWSLLHWDGARVTLMASPGRRDPLLFAQSKSRIVVAPDLPRLRRIDWVGDRIDAEGLLFEIGRAPLRSAIGDRTMLVGVRTVRGGSCVTIDAAGCRVTSAAPLDQAAPWRGSFAEAIEETEHLLRRIVRARMMRAPAACLLSGGLDSSTLAWLAAGERDPGAALPLFSSAAPPNSGIGDETGFAALVADRLALPLTAVVPGETPSIYRPSPATLALANGPTLSVRHYLYDAFADAATLHGTRLLLDGSYGEMTVTGRAPLATPLYRLSALWRSMRYGRPAAPRRDPFHVRLARHRREALPPAIVSAIGMPGDIAKPRAQHDRWGFFEGSYKSLIPSTEMRAGAVRIDYPFRDSRLLRLFSGFPAHFLVHQGLNRAPARHMLSGALPDAIRLRRAGMAFSPDYTQRLQRQAGQARDRITAFRAAGVDDWLDLDWLETALARVNVHGPADIHDGFEVQSTAMVAEFLTWWGSGS